MAAECASFEAATLSALKAVIEEEQIDCDFVLTRAVDALMTDAINDRMKAGFDLLRKAGLPTMGDVSYEGGPGAEQLSGVKGAKGCVSYSAGHLWPYKLICALLQRAVDAGVNLQTHTPVTGVSERPDAEGYYTLTTKERGTLRAKKIVYATNGYTSSILPEFENKIVPVKGICSHIVPRRKPAPHLPNSYIIRWSPTEYEYLIPRLDGSIVVGGARERYYKDLDSWYNTVEDDKLITTGNAHHHFDDYMQKYFKGWEDSGAYTHKVWTGSKFANVTTEYQNSSLTPLSSHGVLIRRVAVRRSPAQQAKPASHRWFHRPRHASDIPCCQGGCPDGPGRRGCQEHWRPEIIQADTGEAGQQTECHSRELGSVQASGA